MNIVGKKSNCYMKKRIAVLLLFAFLLSFGLVVFAEPVISSQSATLLCPDTGNAANSMQTVFDKDSERRLAPMGFAQMLTALIAGEMIALDEYIIYTDDMHAAVSEMEPKPNLLGYAPGERVKAENVLQSLILGGNADSALMIASYISNSPTAFATLMNQKAKELGAENSFFVNPTGIDDPKQYTTAADMARIAAAFFQNPALREMTAAAYFTLPPTNINRQQRIVYSRNGFVSKYYDDRYYNSAVTNAFVTGDGTHYNCAAFVKQGKLSLVSVVMSAPKSDWRITAYKDTADMLSFGFTNFQILTATIKDGIVTETPVKHGRNADYVLLLSSDMVRYLANSSESQQEGEPQGLQVAIETNGELTAPVNKGDILGTATYTYNGKRISTVNLLAAESVALDSISLYGEKLLLLLGEDWLRAGFLYGLGAIAALVLLYLFIRAMLKKRIYKRKRNIRKKNLKASGGANDKNG